MKAFVKLSQVKEMTKLQGTCQITHPSKKNKLKADCKRPKRTTDS